MVLAILVFVLVAGAVIGGFLALEHLPGLLAGRQFEQRLRDMSHAPEDPAAPSVVLNQAPASALPGVDRLMSSTNAGSWLSTLIEQSGVQVSPGTVLSMGVVLGVVIGLITFIFLPRVAVGAAAGACGVSLPILWLRHKRAARIRKFEEQFPEALDLLSRAIRAGHAFQSAMGMVAEELPAPVGSEFKKSFDQQNFGLPLKDALAGMAERMPLMDVKFFITTVAIQRETGGNLSEILDNLAHVVRERFKILRQVRVHTAHGRFTGYVLLGLPAALAIALSFISPEHMRTLFTVHMGQMMILGAIVMQTIGFIWIKQVIKIEV